MFTRSPWHNFLFSPSRDSLILFRARDARVARLGRPHATLSVAAVLTTGAAPVRSKRSWRPARADYSPPVRNCFRQRDLNDAFLFLLTCPTVETFVNVPLSLVQIYRRCRRTLFESTSLCFRLRIVGSWYVRWTHCLSSACT